MPATLVDSNILIDLLTEDEDWIDWSAAARRAVRGAG